MQEPLRIYIAGPYSARGAEFHDVPRIVMQNVNRAIEAGNEIIKKGHYPFIPHLSFYVDVAANNQYPWDLWYDIDNSFLDLWANAFLYLAPSFGADQELDRFKKRNTIEVNGMWDTMPIFYNLNDIPCLKGE